MAGAPPHFRVKILRELADEGPKTAYALAKVHGPYIYPAMREMGRLGMVAHLGKSEGYAITAEGKQWLREQGASP